MAPPAIRPPVNLAPAGEEVIGVCIPIFNHVMNLKLARTIFTLEECSDHPWMLSMGIGPRQVAANRKMAYERLPAEVQYVVHVDDDIIAAPCWASRFIRVLKENPDVGMVSAVMMGTRGEPQNDLHPSAIGPGEIVDRLPIPGTFVMFDRFRFHPEFDLNYKKSQWEDTDMNIQVREAGFRSVATGDVKIIHDNTSRSTFNDETWEVNRAYFYEKWGKDVIQRLAP